MTFSAKSDLICIPDLNTTLLLATFPSQSYNFPLSVTSKGGAGGVNPPPPPPPIKIIPSPI